MSNSQNSTTNVIRVSGKTHPTTLSGYIHTSLKSFEKTCVVAVGPKAISTAMKAIAVARLNIADDNKDIIALPEFADVIMDDIKVNGDPLDERGKEIVNDALGKAVQEDMKMEGENEGKRVHVGMKIFLHEINRIAYLEPTADAQTRVNSSSDVTKGKSSKNLKHNNGKNKNRNKKPLSEEELFLAHLGGKKPKDYNSNGIPRI